MPLPLAIDDTLTYSSSSASRDPHSYRVVRPIGGIVSALARRAPALGQRLTARPPIVVQSYPATLGLQGVGPRLDSYMVPSTACRGIELAASLGTGALVCTTPLLAARIFRAHVQHERAWPDSLLLACGGYPLPRSLEGALVMWAADRGCAVSVVQFFGQAEVDAACLFAIERDTDGQPLYQPRDGLDVAVESGRATVQLDGRAMTLEGVATARSGGVVLEDRRRWSPQVLAELEAWTPADWGRRTGFVRAAAGASVWQLREGQATALPAEQDFYDFARLTRMEWWQKPDWRSGP